MKNALALLQPQARMLHELAARGEYDLAEEQAKLLLDVVNDILRGCIRNHVYMQYRREGCRK